ncbi:MAG: hypothetical protein AAGD04_03095 [Pseudomonadota bacterium]
MSIEAIAAIAAAFSAAAALATAWLMFRQTQLSIEDNRRETEEREKQKARENDLLEKRNKAEGLFRQRDYYLRFVEYCIENESLDVFDVPNAVFERTGYDKKSVMIVYHLILAAERQFLYERLVNGKEATSVEDWKPWLESWSQRDVFIQMWKVLRPIFIAPDRDSRDFVQLVDGVVNTGEVGLHKS